MTNSNSLQMFSNELFNVRVVMRENKPWFVAKDVAECIEHSNVTKMCEMCRSKDKTVIDMGEIETNNLLVSKMTRELTCVSESGLYRILGKSNLPKCEPFESWVFDEVLPSIRQKGFYAIAPKDSYLIEDPIERAKAWIIEQEEKKRIEAERDAAIKNRIAINDKRTATLMVAKREDNKKIKALTCENTELKEQNEILKVSLGESHQWMSSAQLIQNFKLHCINGKIVKPKTLTTMLKKCGCRHRKSDFPDKSGFNYTIFFVDDVKKALNIF